MEHVTTTKGEATDTNLKWKRYSSSSYTRQHSTDWRARREKLLALTKETYLSEGKLLVDELQQAIKDNSNNAYKVILLCYERAVKDIYSYPIAALLFENLGQQIESTSDSEILCNSLQDELQDGLSSLKSRFSRKEKLQGTDVGIVFLLYVLLKLENRRGGEGKFFRDLLIKLFKLFYPYALSASDSLKKGLGDCVISAMCVLCQVAYMHREFQETEQMELILEFFRYCLIHSNIEAIGRVQILYTLEELYSKQSELDADTRTYYKERYNLECKKKYYLLDKIGYVFAELVSAERDLVWSMKELNGSSENDIFRSSRALNQQLGSISMSDLKYLKDSNGNIDKSHSFPNVNDAICSIQRSLSLEAKRPSLSTTQNLGVSSSQIPKDWKVDRMISTKEDMNACSESWDQEETNLSTESITETVNVPEACMERILGNQGAIHQRMEFQSNAKIDVVNAGEYKPVTSSITAHRLVASALGVSPQMDSTKLKEEKEKLAVAKELAVRYTDTVVQREIKITGSSTAVSIAKKLINEIVNYTTNLAVELPGFTIDQVLDTAGAKLETIQVLLNVILKLEEQDDGSVVLHISGDEKSCEDARKLAIEELGRLKFATGRIVRMPMSLTSILTSKDQVISFSCKLMELSESRIRVLRLEEEFCFFLHGSASYKAENLLNKVNTELVFNKKQIKESFQSEPGDEEELSLSLDDLFVLMNRLFKSGQIQPLQDIPSKTTHEKDRKVYDRLFLLQCSASPHANDMPLELKKIKGDEEDVFNSFINPMGNSLSQQTSDDNEEVSVELSGSS